MNLKELLTAVCDVAGGIRESSAGRPESEVAAELADFFRVQAENLTIFLRQKQGALGRHQSNDNTEHYRLAADNLRHVCVASAETVWCLRQVNQRKEGA